MAKVNKIHFALVAGIFVAVVVLLLGFQARQAKANALDLIQSNVTATTTRTFIVSGANATSTTYDTFGGGLSDPNATDNLAMLVQFTASTSASVVTWKYQFSQDAIDWYDDNTTIVATSSATVLTTGETYVLQGNTTASTTLKTVVLPHGMPTRYVRAVFAISGNNAAVWSTFVAQKQQP